MYLSPYQSSAVYYAVKNVGLSCSQDLAKGVHARGHFRIARRTKKTETACSF